MASKLTRKQVFEGFRFVKSTSLEQIAEAILACSGRLASFTENIFTTNKAIDQSINQSINQSVSESVNHSMNGYNNKRMNE